MFHEDPYKSLVAELLVEAAAREAAHKRVLVLRTYSKLAVSLTSFFVVCTSIITLVFANVLTPLGITVLSCATLFTTIYSMMVDSLESSKNYSEKIFKMEKSSIEMKRLYDRLRQTEESERKDSIRSIQTEKGSLVDLYGNVYSITDHNYARWIHRDHLEALGVGSKAPPDAEKKYLSSRYQVFWAYLIFPLISLAASLWYSIQYASNGP